MVSKNLGIAILALALAGGLGAPAAAQDTTQPGQQPQQHVVQTGETLWGLARLYLGDPFLWPEIYRINTGVVEDPHWIFPGEVLTLVQPDATQVVAQQPVQQQAQQPVQAPPAVMPPADTVAVQEQAVQRPVEMVELPAALPAAPPPAAETGPTIFARSPVAQQRQPVQVGPRESYRGVRVGDFYRAGFLTEGQSFAWGDVQGIADPGTARGAATGGGAATALLYQEIRIEAPQGAGYQVGDSLLVVRVGREVPGGWGRIIMPAGIVRVVSTSGRDAVGRILEQYDQIREGQRVIPLEPFPRQAGARPQPVSGGIEGLVITRRELTPIPIQYDVMFIDLGRNVGVAPGDRFELLATPDMVSESPAGSPVLAEVEIVHVRERSATAVIQSIFTPGIRVAGRNPEGIPVRLVAKMPA